MLERHDCVACDISFYGDIAGLKRFSRHDARFNVLYATRVAVAVVALTSVCAQLRAQQPEQRPSFEVPKKDSADAQALAKQITALSSRVDPREATSLADCAYATASRLRKQYRMFGTPIFNNFLVYHGLRKRGYCYQWMEDLLVALDTLKLKTLELHWAETYAGTWRENNCLVVTAKGQPFEHGVILDAWRHLGHLSWHLLLSDEDRYVENRKYAQMVRARAASQAAGSTGHVAFQSKADGNSKTGE
jgi:hypothetical protein